MKTHTNIEVSNILFNSYFASSNLVSFVINDKEFYRFEKGDVLSIVGIVKHPDQKTAVVLVTVNNAFDFEELLITELSDYVDISKCIELSDKTATADSQHKTSKTRH
jgi:hypothetical protein